MRDENARASTGIGLSYTCQVDISLKCFFNFTLAFLLPFNLINRMEISSLYIWGEHLPILNSLCPYESCDGTLAVCIKPRLIEDEVKKI